MDEHLLFLLYLFGLLLLMRLTSEVLLPFLGSFWLPLRHFDDVFKRVDSVAHFGVELLLDSVHMEVHILTETGHKSKGLLKASLEMQIGIKLYSGRYAR